jgi:hypothetical protein
MFFCYSIEDKTIVTIAKGSEDTGMNLLKQSGRQLNAKMILIADNVATKMVGTEVVNRRLDLRWYISGQCRFSSLSSQSSRRSCGQCWSASQSLSCFTSTSYDMVSK